jgi:hypothetical protein
VHRDPADVVAEQLDLAGVQANPNLQTVLGSSTRMAWAARMARAGPSKVARNPSPVVLTLPCRR